MKLFKFELTTLKSKLYAIVFASFVVRVVAFFVLPATPSSLGPDEGTYSALAKWTEQGLPASDFPLYGAGLYQSARSLIWPAAMFIQLGFDPLQSVRLTATIYGLLSVWIVVFVFLKTLDFRAGLAEYVSRKRLLVTSIFAVFAFLPSHFIWSLLGLRESAIEFWTLSAFISLYWIFHFHFGHHTLMMIQSNNISGPPTVTVCIRMPVFLCLPLQTPLFLMHCHRFCKQP